MYNSTLTRYGCHSARVMASAVKGKSTTSCSMSATSSRKSETSSGKSAISSGKYATSSSGKYAASSGKSATSSGKYAASSSGNSTTSSGKSATSSGKYAASSSGNSVTSSGMSAASSGKSAISSRKSAASIKSPYVECKISRVKYYDESVASSNKSTASFSVDEDNFLTPMGITFTNSSVLARAIQFENVTETTILLKKGCDPNKPVGNHKMRPMMLAAFIKNDRRRLAIFKHLIEHKADPELTDNRDSNCLMYVCAHDLLDEMVELLDNYIFSFYNKNKRGNMLLHVCAKYSSVEITKLVHQKMRKYSMDLNVRNGDGHTALDVALINNNLKCAEWFFMEKGQSTLPEHGNGPKYFMSIKGHLWMEKHGKTPTDAYKEEAESSMDKEEAEKPKKLTVSDVMRPKPGYVRQDPEEIVYRLLAHQAKVGPVDYKPDRRVPLDANWTAQTRAHLKVISEMEKLTVESVTKKQLKNQPKSEIDKIMAEAVHKLPDKFPARLWRKVLANTASRSLMLTQWEKCKLHKEQDQCEEDEDEEDEDEADDDEEDEEDSEYEENERDEEDKKEDELKHHASIA